MFLFHTGSIKRICETAEKLHKAGFYSILVRLKVTHPVHRLILNSLFLFHTGSIKSRFRSWDVRCRRCFYSILVRLKVKSRILPFSGYVGFYSILVRLKAVAKTVKEIQRQCFYSILVRLKVNRLCRCVRLFWVSIPYWFD